MGKAIILLILLFFVSPSYGATIYQWVDDNGTYNFTDNYEMVPSAYRNQVHLKKLEDVPEMEPSLLPSAPKAPSRNEEVKKDIYDMGEEWWRRRVRPWNNQLEEASKNYQIANEEFFKESKKLILRKFGSHHQFKSTILVMDRIRQERTKYEVQIDEAKEMLKRISKEAEEAEADPLWLTADSSTPDQLTSLETAEIERDIYGRDESWWRQKLFAHRKKLKEAVENHEKAYEKYRREIEKLGPSRFGKLSLTQYQMIACRLDNFNNEMAKYQLQITEADEMLRKILKEAEESKANPEWVK